MNDESDKTQLVRLWRIGVSGCIIVTAASVVIACLGVIGLSPIVLDPLGLIIVPLGMWGSLFALRRSILRKQS